MDRNHLRLGPGDLGNPPKTSRSLGRRPLGASAWRLDICSRPLAIANSQKVSSNSKSIRAPHQPRIFANINGATIVASDSITKRGVSTLSFPQVIFSLGTAPEYDPKLVVESLIWQK